MGSVGPGGGLETAHPSSSLERTGYICINGFRMGQAFGHSADVAVHALDLVGLVGSGCLSGREAALDCVLL